MAKAEQEGKSNDLKSVLRELERAEKHTAHLAGQVLKIESQLKSATEKHLMSADRLIKLRAQKSRLVKLEQAAEAEQALPKVPELPKGAEPQMQEQMAQCVQAMAAAKQTMDQMHQQMEAIVKLASEKAAAKQAEQSQHEEAGTGKTDNADHKPISPAPAASVLPANKQRKTNTGEPTPGSEEGQPLSPEHAKAASKEEVAKQGDADGNFKRLSEDEQAQAKALADQMLAEQRAKLQPDPEGADKGKA